MNVFHTTSTFWRGAVALLMVPTVATDAQSSLQRFTIGGRDISRVDIAGTAVGDFPASIQMIDGIMEIVDVNGQRMLRASSRSSFLVRLPQVLPQDFTLEFEIVPKASGNPEDLAIEGTATIDQGAGSANVMWHRDYLQIVGGGATYDSKVPESFAAGLPGVLTHVAVTVQGPMMKLYTNGRLMYTQQRRFVRGRVLRVFLGGQDDGPNAVYLASMRVVDGVSALGPIAGAVTGNANRGGGGANQSPPGGSGGGTRAGPPLSQVGAGGNTGGAGGNSGSTGASGGSSENAGTPAPNTSRSPVSLTASASGLGVSLTWAVVPGATSYRVFRKESGTAEVGALAQFVVELPPHMANTHRDAIDPHVVPGVDMTYWIEAVFADGRSGPPSPVASAAPRWLPTGLPGPANLQVSIPGTQSLGALNGAPGSLVTWTWDATPSQYGYGVGVDMMKPNQLPQAIRDYVFTPPVSPTDLSPQPAKYTRAIPQGMDVMFCVFFWRTDDARMIPAELSPPKPGLSCVSARVP